MTTNELKEKGAGHLVSYIVEKITELEFLDVDVNLKINFLKAIIHVIENSIIELEEK